MKFATLHAYHLLKSEKPSSYIIKELTVMQQHQLITPTVVNYILKRHKISPSLYKSTFHALKRFNYYNTTNALEPVPS